MKNIHIQEHFIFPILINFLLMEFPVGHPDISSFTLKIKISLPFTSIDVSLMDYYSFFLFL